MGEGEGNRRAQGLENMSLHGRGELGAPVGDDNSRDAKVPDNPLNEYLSSGICVHICGAWLDAHILAKLVNNHQQLCEFVRAVFRQPTYEVEGDYLPRTAGEYWVEEAWGGVCVVFLFLASVARTHEISGITRQARPGPVALSHLLCLFSAEVACVRGVVIFGE